MIPQLNTFKKIIFIIFIITLAGCAKSLPLAFQKPKVNLEKSEVQWSRDFGPEMAGNFRSIDVADFNNDGNLDIVGGSTEQGSIFLWDGDGLGNWKRKQRFPIKADILSLEVGDINNDGWIDILSSSIGNSEGIQVWINKNGFFEPGRPVTEREIYEGLKLVDINNDSNLDLIAANNTSVESGGIRVWLGNGRGDFFGETGPTRMGMYRDVAVGDLNHDGKLDIVGAGWFQGKGALNVWLGTGDGRWSRLKSPVEKGSFRGVDISDVNNDGNVDIVAATSFAGVEIYYGDGNGGFPEKEVLTSKGSFWMAKAIDIDKNGLIDIVAASNNNNGIIVWYQKGKGKWVAKDEGLPAEGYFFDFVAVDFNQDHKIDIASATHGEGIRAWFGGAYTPDLPEKTKKKVEKKTGVNKKALSEKIIERERIVIPEISTSIFFDSNTADLRPEYKVVLSKVIERLKKFKNITLKVEGHADSKSIVGSEKFLNNQALALTRAKAVANFMISSGLDEERITISAHVKAVPDIPGDDADSYQIYRRVDIITSKVEVVNILHVDEKKDADQKINGGILEENVSQVKYEFEDPFRESGDVIPATEFKAFKIINNIPEYRIGPGDVLAVTIWEGITEKQHEVVVTPKGTVTFSFFTDFKIKGLTPTETEKEFRKLLKEVIVTPKIKVIVTKKQAHTVSIFGAVNSPGTYVLLGQERLTQFLSRARVNLRTADLTRVQLTRSNRTYFLNISDALFKGDFRQDEVIDSGDVIFVPNKRQILKKLFVMGEVAKPGMFVYEGKLTLLEAIVQAGGPTFYGKTSDVIIIRGSETKPEGIKVNFDDIFKKGDYSKNILLQQGDIVYIAKNTVGNISEFMTKISPFINVARLPMEVYGATALPIWEGFPLVREAAPSAQQVIQPPARTLPPGAGNWQLNRIK